MSIEIERNPAPIRQITITCAKEPADHLMIDFEPSGVEFSIYDHDSELDIGVAVSDEDFEQLLQAFAEIRREHTSPF